MKTENYKKIKFPIDNSHPHLQPFSLWLFSYIRLNNLSLLTAIDKVISVSVYSWHRNNYRNDPKSRDRNKAFANSVDPNQMP